MTEPPTRPYCGLCREPKIKIAGDVYICEHCDTTIGCRGDKCGACERCRLKTYPYLDETA